MPNMPENLTYDREEHKKLTGDLSPFDTFKGDKNQIDVFMLGLAFGFKSKQSLPLDKKKDLSYLRLRTRGEEFFWQVRPLAIVEKGDITPLIDESKIFHNAEEYSNYGVKKIVDLVYDQQGADPMSVLLNEIERLAKKH